MFLIQAYFSLSKKSIMYPSSQYCNIPIYQNKYNPFKCSIDYFLPPGERQVGLTTERGFIMTRTKLQKYIIFVQVVTLLLS